MAYSDDLIPVLQAIQTRLLAYKVFTQVGISLRDVQPTLLIANYVCNLQPTTGSYDSPQVSGGGRYTGGYLYTINVQVYGRNATDRIYLDTNKLTDATLGILQKTQATYDVLQLFLPLDSNSKPLLEEPMRLLREERPVKYGRSPESVRVNMVFEARSKFNLDPSNP